MNKGHCQVFHWWWRQGHRPCRTQPGEPEGAVADLKAGSTKLLPLAGDITSDTDVDTIYEKVLAEFGTVDILVNATGAMNVGPIGVLQPSKWWENFVSLTVPTCGPPMC